MSEYEGHGDIIYPADIDARIRRLTDLRMDHDLNEDGQMELDACKQFREDVHDLLGASAWTSSRGFIADAYFAKYADDHAADLYGRDVVDLPYWNDDAYEDDERDHFQEIDFEDVTYLVDKEV
jgi:hypothetical protein